VVKRHTQLSDIPGKSVTREAREGGTGEPLWLGAWRGELPKDRGRQFGEIATISQRRDREDGPSEAMIEIGAEGSGGDRFGEWDAGRGDQSELRLPRSFLPDAVVTAIFQDTK
jgi:hypothetical protein